MIHDGATREGGISDEPPDGMLGAALDYAKQGLPSIPLYGKKPRVADWPTAGSTDPEILREWWGKWPGANIGCITGARSGYVVADADQEELPEGLPPTQTARTGGGGHHLWYRHPGGVILNRSGVWPGVDKIKGDGGFVVMPPSIHPETGRPYEWIENGAEVADLPEQIAEACRPRDFGEPVEAITSLTTTAYGRAALEAECKAVAETPPPETRPPDEKGRNDRLYEAALKIGSLIAGGEIARTSEAPKALAQAAYRAGLDHEETKATLSSGLLAGRNRPRSAPNREPDLPANEGGATPTPPDDRAVDETATPAPLRRLKETAQGAIELVVERASQIRGEPVSWCWEGRWPLGSVSLVTGEPGCNKSTLACERAARLTRGKLIGNLLGRGENVLIASAEDSPATTLRPRLEAAAADLDRVSFLSVSRDGIKGDIQLPEDIERLREVVMATHTKLVIIDPLVAHLAGTVNSHKDQDIRRVLAPLARLADETRCAVCCIVHTNKAEGTNFFTRVGGSIGLTGAARSGLIVANDPRAPEGSPFRIVAHGKSNLGPKQPTERFEVMATELPSGIKAVRILWRGIAADVGVGDALGGGQGTRQAPERNAARLWLSSQLRGTANRSISVSALKQMVNDAGHTWATIRRARYEIGAVSRREGGFSGDGHWEWYWPPENDPEHVALDPDDDPGSGTSLPETHEGAHQSDKGAHPPENVSTLDENQPLFAGQPKGAQIQNHVGTLVSEVNAEIAPEHPETEATGAPAVGGAETPSDGQNQVSTFDGDANKVLTDPEKLSTLDATWEHEQESGPKSPKVLTNPGTEHLSELSGPEDAPEAGSLPDLDDERPLTFDEIKLICLADGFPFEQYADPGNERTAYRDEVEIEYERKAANARLRGQELAELKEVTG